MFYIEGKVTQRSHRYVCEQRGSACRRCGWDTSIKKKSKLKKQKSKIKKIKNKNKNKNEK